MEQHLKASGHTSPWRPWANSQQPQYWVNNTPHPATEAGAPTLGNIQVNGNSIEIGPFNTAGTYHIYCTVHPGMNLTVIVQ